MTEVELKLTVDEGFVLPPLEQSGVAAVEELPELDLRATYHDTSDLRLMRHGVTLRHRTGEGDRSGWCLKLPLGKDGGISRDEVHLSGGPRSVPAEARDLVTAFARSSPLAPVIRLRTKRRRWCLRDAAGGELAELADDKVSVVKKGKVVERFRELELEGRALDASCLERLGAALRDAGASALAPVPKAVRALGGEAALSPELDTPPAVSPRDPAAYAVRAAIAGSVQRIITNDARTRLGEAEPLHQMRVGARRLRSDLRTFAPLVHEEWADALRGELKWLAAALGRVRDLDVMQARLRSSAEGLERLELVFDHMDEQHRAASEALLDELRSERYRDLLETLVGAGRSPALTPSAWEPCELALPPLARKAWQKLAAKRRALDPSDPDERYHRVRILAKRARYAAEAIAPALGPDRGKRAARFARRAAGVQDVLGSLQDASVARETVLDLARKRLLDGSFAIAAGRLVERQDRDAREARHDFDKAWQKLYRRKHLRWLAS
jgi:inorganic triphosphatase YgiF